MAGSIGQALRVEYTPANDGTHDEVTAEISNTHNLRFEHGLVKFLMPKGYGSADVTGGTLMQVDDSGSVDVYYVEVDIQPVGSQTVTITLSTTDVAAEEGIGRPGGLHLAQNHPNPFNPSTTLSYSLPSAGYVRLSVYDGRGRQVALLVDQEQSVGEHVVEWDGRDKTGERVASGVYFVRLSAAGDVRSRKIVLAK
jgi:hypothetical protein